VNINIQEKGRAALSWASGEGHVSIVELLLDKGADINHMDNVREFGRLSVVFFIYSAFATFHLPRLQWLFFVNQKI